jgi:hypothetical protein
MAVPRCCVPQTERLRLWNGSCQDFLELFGRAAKGFSRACGIFCIQRDTSDSEPEEKLR